MSLPKMRVKNFTVSTSFEVNRGGQKSSHFVSLGVELEEPIDIEDFPRAQLLAGYKAHAAANYDALVRGAISLEESNDRISSSQANYELIQANLDKKAQDREKQKEQK